MPIKGITDKQTISHLPPKVDIRVYKGAKKKAGKTQSGKEYLGYGDDLVDRLRIDCKNKALNRSILAAFPGSKLGDDECILVDKLDIILAYNNLEKAFDTKMTRYSTGKDSLSGLIWECDRETIYQKKEEYTDTFGGKRSRYLPCNEPCPVANSRDKCPHGCQQQGTLYFYLPALLDRGHNVLCSLVVSGSYDLPNITRSLYQVQDTYGTIKNTPNSPQTYNSILYVLGRETRNLPHPVFVNGQRSGKTSNKPTHLISLDIQPDWLSYYQQMQRIDRVKALGYRPNMKLIEQVVGCGAIESSSDLILPPWQPTDEQLEELRVALKNNKWTEARLRELLLDRFGVDLEGVRTLSEREFQEVVREVSFSTP